MGAPKLFTICLHKGIGIIFNIDFRFKSIYIKILILGIGFNWSGEKWFEFWNEYND